MAYLKSLKKLGKKIVLVTGCFDLLHPAHQQFLIKAKAEGDLLLVGLESDYRLRKLKGEERPINPWLIRAKNLAVLKFVDFIFPLPLAMAKASVQEKIIRQIKPAILAVSSHSQHLQKKRTLMAKYGGKLKVVMTYDPRFSTSKLLSTLKKANKNKKAKVKKKV